VKTNISIANRSRSLLSASALFLLTMFGPGQTAQAAHPQPESEKAFYVIEDIPMPEGTLFEACAMTRLPGDRLAIATRRGEVWIVSNIFGKTKDIQFDLFASGLEEPLGIAYKDGWFYTAEHTQISRLRDEDGDGTADIYETFNNDWGTTPGDTYHEFVFMAPEHDQEGNLWVTLCLTNSSSSSAYLRGWSVRITPDGKLIPTTSGVRSPGGVGYNAKGDVFYCDNQGFWNGSSCLKHLKPGSFQGNPKGNTWYSDPRVKQIMGEAPVEPVSGSRIDTERARIKEFVPPAVVFPHGKIGTSPTGIDWDRSKGKFGPFSDQMFVGEITHSQVQRVFLEEVNGVYQGAVFKFLSGFDSGIVGVNFAEEGYIFTGGTNRGWGARGGKPQSFERVRWTGKTPFEILKMEAQPDGFVITFTEPADLKTAGDPASYKMSSWTYIYQEGYGSPEVDGQDQTITAARVSADGLSVRLTIDNLVKGHVHHLESPGVKSASNSNLWHTSAYYTLNEIPSP